MVTSIEQMILDYQNNLWFASSKQGIMKIVPNQFTDLFARYQNLEGEKTRERTEQSFFVPKQEIVDNGYDLSINKYKKTEYVPVEYPPTSEILQKIDDLEVQIQKELAELKVMLNQTN